MLIAQLSVSEIQKVLAQIQRENAKKQYCQMADTGIYSVASLAPPLQEVRQVEIEAGDCEGRLPLVFLCSGLRIWICGSGNKRNSLECGGKRVFAFLALRNEERDTALDFESGLRIATPLWIELVRRTPLMEFLIFE
jgi:hypothetical protein